MKKILPLLLLVIFTALPGTAAADFLGVRIGASLWGHQPTGGIADGGAYNGLHDDLHLGSNTQVGLFASLEHPLPLLPNIALRYNNVSSSGDGTVKAQFGSISPSTTVHTNLNLDQLDGILYYELLDNVVSLDAGVDVKVIHGKVKMTGSSGSVDRGFTGAIPMLYLSVGAALPFTGLSADVKGSFMAYSGNHLSDITASVSYETSLGLGVSAGYRTENLKVKDLNNINVDATVDGPFGAVFYHF